MQIVRVAVLDDYQQVALSLADWSPLSGRADITVFNDPAGDEDALVERLAPFDVVVAMRERTAFPASVLTRLPRLRLLVSTGLRNASIDIAAGARQGVVMAGARDARNGVACTVETTWALVLALHKRLVASHNALCRQGRWQPHLAEGLEGKVLGIVGLGNIGQRVARIAQAFGMEVIAWSPNLTEDRARGAGVRLATKTELFASADTVSLHLTLGPATRSVVARAELEAMKPGAFIVNTARAALVNEHDLFAALRERRIGGAGLDVFWQEPLAVGHPICGLDNVVLSPHLGYATTENMAAYYRAVIREIGVWLDGGQPTPLGIFPAGAQHDPSHG